MKVSVFTLALLCPAELALAETPWFTRPACAEVVELVMRPDFAGADAKLARMERSNDPEEIACALWTRASAAEFQISMLGKSPELVANRKKAITRLGGFAKAHQGLAPHFADLEIEARLRKVRVLNEEGQRSQALDEIKQIQKQLEKRGEKLSSPAHDYAIGVLNAAMASPGWAARAVLSVVGVGSDADVAAKHLHRLIDGDTVYRWDAAYVAQFFGAEIGGETFRATSAYVTPLGEKFPDNPLFAYERALVALAAKDVKRARELLAAPVAKIEAEPTAWGAPIRARVLWAAGRAALDAGDKPLASKYAQLAKAEKVKELGDRIDDLLDDVE